MRPSFRLRAGPWESALRGAVGVLLAVTLWDVAVRFAWIDPLLLPTPWQVFAQFWRGWTVPSIGQSKLLAASLATLGHFGLGFGLAILVGVSVGAILAMTPRMRDYMNATVRLFQYTPPAALLPLLILYFDRGRLTIALYIVFGSAWPILIHTRDALSSRDQTLIAAARNLGWKGRQLFLHILLPASVSEILSGIRVSSSIALITTIVAEFLAGEAGLGFEILLAQRTFEYRSMYSGIVCLAIIGLAMNCGLMLAERYFTRWRTSGDLLSIVE